MLCIQLCVLCVLLCAACTCVCQNSKWGDGAVVTVFLDMEERKVRSSLCFIRSSLEHARLHSAAGKCAQQQASSCLMRKEVQSRFELNPPPPLPHLPGVVCCQRLRAALRLWRAARTRLSHGELCLKRLSMTNASAPVWPCIYCSLCAPASLPVWVDRG